MKKKLVLVLFAFILFLFSGCDLFKNLNVKIESIADNKDESMQLLDEFFEGTLENPNFRVIKTANDEELGRENVIGQNSFVRLADGSESYFYMIDGNCYYVYVGQEEIDGELKTYRYFLTSDESKAYYNSYAEEYYANGYCSFLSDFYILKNMAEENGTFNASYVVEGTEEQLNGTFELTFTATNGVITITGTTLNGLVLNASIRIVNNAASSNNRSYDYSFEYDCAEINLPDTDEWQRQNEEDNARRENNETAISERDQFLADLLESSNVVVTASDEDGVLFSEAIMGIFECLTYDDYRIYTFYEEVEDETNYYYVSDSEDEKYYTVNGEEYDYSILVYYHNFICNADELAETGTITYESKDNSFVFTLTDSGVKLFEMTAQKTDGKVTSISLYFNYDESENTINLTIEYGTASITKPNLANYTLRTSEE